MAKNKQVRAYAKEQITRSEKYKPHRDVLSSILEAEKEYTADEVDRILKNWLEKGLFSLD